MATLILQQLDDAVYARLSRQAAENNRSIEAEARAQLGEPAAAAGKTSERPAWIESLRQFSLRMREKYGDGADSVALVRHIRDAE